MMGWGCHRSGRGNKGVEKKALGTFSELPVALHMMGTETHQGLTHFSEVNSAASEGGSGRPSQRGPWTSLCCGRLWQSGKVHGILPLKA